MLSVDKFHRAQIILFADLPAVVNVKKCFALGDHRMVMPFCATDRQRSPSVQPSCNCTGKLSCADSRSFVEIPCKSGSPVRRPLRYQADPPVVIGTGEIKEVVALSEAEFVSWFATERNLPGPRFHAGGVQIQRFLKFRASFVSFAHGPQRPRSSCTQVRAFWIHLHGAVQCPQSVFNSALA